MSTTTALRRINGVIHHSSTRINSSGTAAWYLTDRLESIRGMVDNSGALQETVAYDGYGNITSDSKTTFGDRYKFTGRELDSVTGLQYNRARYYSGFVGRWVSQDPMGFRAGDYNLFRFEANSPTCHSDPSGLEIPGPRYDPFKPLPPTFPPAPPIQVKLFKRAILYNCLEPETDDTILQIIGGTKVPMVPNKCLKWTNAAWSQLESLDIPGVSISQTAWTFTSSPKNLWCIFVDSHFAIQVKFDDGQVFYFDDGAWGGIFQMGEIPPYAN